MTKTIDQWAAEQCGVELYTKRCTIPDAYDTYSGTGIAHWFDQTIGDYDEWTIKDPRCCKIFRDWWLSKDTSNAVLIFNDEVTYFRDYAYGQGDPTTRDTEEACITAIYEASQ